MFSLSELSSAWSPAGPVLTRVVFPPPLIPAGRKEMKSFGETLCWDFLGTSGWNVYWLLQLHKTSAPGSTTCPLPDPSSWRGTPFLLVTPNICCFACNLIWKQRLQTINKRWVFVVLGPPTQPSLTLAGQHPSNGRLCKGGHSSPTGLPFP